MSNRFWRPWLKSLRWGVDQDENTLHEWMSDPRIDNGTYVDRKGRTRSISGKVQHLFLVARNESVNPILRRDAVLAARLDLARRYEAGNGISADTDKAMFWYWLIRRESVEACYRLGRLLRAAGEQEAARAAFGEADGLRYGQFSPADRLCLEQASAERALMDIDTGHAARDSLKTAFELLNSRPDADQDLLDRARQALGLNEPPPDQNGVVVIKAIGDARASSRKEESLKQYLDLVGKTLPLIRPEVEQICATLAREFPWLAEANRRIAAALRARSRIGSDAFRLDPLLLIGPPGSGKTRFASRLAELAGLPHRLIAAGGSSDNRALAGTARGWGSGKCSAVVDLLVENRIANAVVIVDELEKASANRYNGCIWDTLLQMFEPENAARFHDEYLLGPVDLSWVTWICTANSRAGLPEPLMNRLTVIDAPLPADAAHLGAVVRTTREEYARRNRVPLEMIPQPPPGFIEALGIRSPRLVKRATEKIIEGMLEDEWQNRSVH